MKKINQINAVVLFYPTLLWNVFLSRIIKKRNWWDEIDDYVVLGAIPFYRDVKILNDMGVTCIINLCAECDGPMSLYSNYKMQYFHIPTTDFMCPSVESIDLGVSIIQRYAEQNRKVYIHCKAGRGRSATVVFCWLVKCRNYKPEQAMKYLLCKRPHINKHIYNKDSVKRYLSKV